jgi:hypothetical protein
LSEPSRSIIIQADEQVWDRGHRIRDYSADLPTLHIGHSGYGTLILDEYDAATSGFIGRALCRRRFDGMQHPRAD